MKEGGITIIEIVVVVAIIGILLSILITNFPAIQRQFALSRATHKLAQDIRRAEALALSASDEVINAQGYGIYIGKINPKQYILYADLKNIDNNPSRVENQYDDLDTIIDIIDLAKESPGVSVDSISSGSNPLSVNFTPPNPKVTISGPANIERAWIALKLDNSIFSNNSNTRYVYVWKSGLVQTQ